MAGITKSPAATPSASSPSAPKTLNNKVGIDQVLATVTAPKMFQDNRAAPPFEAHREYENYITSTLWFERSGDFSDARSGSSDDLVYLTRTRTL
jgi:hypothetical protein